MNHEDLMIVMQVLPSDATEIVIPSRDSRYLTFTSNEGNKARLFEVVYNAAPYGDSGRRYKARSETIRQALGL